MHLEQLAPTARRLLALARGCLAVQAPAGQPSVKRLRCGSGSRQPAAPVHPPPWRRRPPRRHASRSRHRRRVHPVRHSSGFRSLRIVRRTIARIGRATASHRRPGRTGGPQCRCAVPAALLPAPLALSGALPPPLAAPEQRLVKARRSASVRNATAGKRRTGCAAPPSCPYSAASARLSSSSHSSPCMPSHRAHGNCKFRALAVADGPGSGCVARGHGDGCRAARTAAQLSAATGAGGGVSRPHPLSPSPRFAGMAECGCSPVLRFSWAVPPSAAALGVQRSHRIRVSAAGNGSLVWDSGWVVGSHSINVEHDARRLGLRSMPHTPPLGAPAAHGARAAARGGGTSGAWHATAPRGNRRRRRS